MANKNNESLYRISILMDAKLNNQYARLYLKKKELDLAIRLDARIGNASDLFNKSLFLGFKVIIGKIINKSYDQITLEDIDEALK